MLETFLNIKWQYVQFTTVQPRDLITIHKTLSFFLEN